MGKHFFLLTALFSITIIFFNNLAVGQTLNLPDQSESIFSYGLIGFPISGFNTSDQIQAISDTAISYFNPSLPTYDFVAGGNYGVIIPIFGERFTTSQISGGYLDSLTIQIDSTNADSLTIAVLGTLKTPNGFFVMNIASGSYGGVTIKGSVINGPTKLRIMTGHIHVPQNFYIAVQPSYSTTLNAYQQAYLRGDVEPTRVKTISNTHSGFVYLNGNNPTSTTLDSVITPNGFSSPLYSNFYMTTYISYSASSVAEPNSSSALTVFPNPASTRLTIQTSTDESRTVELLDLLGREILSATVSRVGTLDVSNIPDGRYQIISYSREGIITAPVIIMR